MKFSRRSLLKFIPGMLVPGAIWATTKEQSAGKIRAALLIQFQGEGPEQWVYVFENREGKLVSTRPELTVINSGENFINIKTSRPFKLYTFSTEPHKVRQWDHIDPPEQIDEFLGLCVWRPKT